MTSNACLDTLKLDFIKDGVRLVAVFAPGELYKRGCKPGEEREYLRTHHDELASLAMERAKPGLPTGRKVIIGGGKERSPL